jgi:aspartate racemase
MKTIGLVGGIGPESTIDYYRLFMAAGHAKVIINSVEVQRLLQLMSKGNTRGVADYLCEAVEHLADGGAELAMIGANTPHVVFGEVAARSRIPMVSIVEAVAQHVSAAGWRRVGLLGTRFTMAGRFYPDVFSKHGLSVEPPNTADLEYLHEKYVGEFLENQFLPDTRIAILSMIDRMKSELGIDAVILGGTELPILLRSDAHNGLPLLDSTRIHAAAALLAAR